VGTRAGRTGAENLAPTGILSPNRPSLSESLYRLSCPGPLLYIQGVQNVSVHLMITIQKIATNVHSVPRQSPDMYSYAGLCSRRSCSVQHGTHSECIL
jgi:hypothetical protein